MRAVASLPRSIIVIEVLEHAEQPRVFELGCAAGFVLHDPGGGFRKPLVFCDHSAGNEVTVFGRLVGAQAEQHFATPSRMTASSSAWLRKFGGIAG